MIHLVQAVHNNPFSSISSEKLRDWIEIVKNVPVLEELDDSEIVQSFKNQEDHVQEMETDHKEETTADPDKTEISWRQASEELDTFAKLAETNKSYNPDGLINMYAIQNDFLHKKSDARMQHNISDSF